MYAHTYDSFTIQKQLHTFGKIFTKLSVENIN